LLFLGLGSGGFLRSGCPGRAARRRPHVVDKIGIGPPGPFGARTRGLSLLRRQLARMAATGISLSPRWRTALAHDLPTHERRVGFRRAPLLSRSIPVDEP